MGAYPTITLKAARDNREEAKRLLANGIDPSMQRRLEKQITSTENTFKAVAEEVLAKMEKEGRSDATLTKKRWLLDFAYPTLGDRPIAEITAPEVLRYSLAVASRRSKATMRPPAFRGNAQAVLSPIKQGGPSEAAKIGARAQLQKEAARTGTA